MRRLIFLFLLLINISSYGITNVKIILPESEKDVRYTYYLDLLKLSLDKTTKKYGKYQLNIQYRDVTRKRLISYLADGSPDLDVIWTGTTIEREKIMLPVRVPLPKGLKGCRLLLINKDKKDAKYVPPFCEKGAPKKQMTNDEVMKNVGAYSAAKAKDADKIPASAGIVDALLEAYPCKKTADKKPAETQKKK